uniref:EGF-like domain-containing protein n=1 Tax=Strigamia maritima TaxID=126957 RepID=T1IKS0_STRMM
MVDFDLSDCYCHRNNILNGTCNKHSECSQLYSRCVNDRCRCIEGYNALNNNCDLKSGKIGDTCKTQIDCKGRFTYCQEKTCQCINGFTASGQDCVLKNDDNRCQYDMDCRYKQFSLCHQGNCICKEDYYMQGAACIPYHGIIGDVCTFDSNCKTINSICHEQHCVCKDDYYSQGYDCAPKTFLAVGQRCQDDGNCPLKGTRCKGNYCLCISGVNGYECFADEGHVPTKRENPAFIQGFGASCTTDEDCYETMFCGRQERKCLCRPGFAIFRGQCHFIPPPHLPPTFESQNKPATAIQQPLTNKPLNQGGYGSPCSNNGNCDVTMQCYQERICICLPGFVPIGIHIHALQHPHVYPGYGERNPTNVEQSGSRPESSNRPETSNNPPPGQQLPLKTEDQNLHITISDRKPAKPGYPCTSSSDCQLDHLDCDLRNKQCICGVLYTLEGNECVRHINTELKPGHTSFKQTMHVKSKISHGQSCKADSDCYHEGLVCNAYILRCVCGNGYYLDGEFCVIQTVGETPTIHVPKTPEINYQLPVFTPRPYSPNIYNPQQPFVNQPNPYREFVNQPNPHREFVNQPNPYREFVNQPNPYREFVNQPNPHRQFVNQPNPYREFVNQPNPHRQFVNQPNPHRQFVNQPNPYRPFVNQPNPPQPIYYEPYVNQPNVYRPYSYERPRYFPSNVAHYNPTPYRPHHPMNNPSEQEDYRRTYREISCISDLSCLMPFSYCNVHTGTCDCEQGYNKIGYNCVKDVGYCFNTNECKGRNTYCHNFQCVCYPNHYRAGGIDCFYAGKIGDFCYNDNDCSYKHSHCFQQKCQCAEAFVFTHGTCQPEIDYFGTSCNSDCDTHNSECESQISRCKCKTGYTLYRQTCIADGDLFGHCITYNRCNKKGVTCQRSTAKCVCDTGYKVYLFSCIPSSQPGLYN